MAVVAVRFGGRVMDDISEGAQILVFVAKKRNGRNDFLFFRAGTNETST